jgi:hypothetical protein
MILEEALLIVEQAVEPKQLNKIQKLILQHSWQGYSYSEIAKATGYDYGYIKDAGSKLWQMLSNSLGEKVNRHLQKLDIDSSMARVSNSFLEMSNKQNCQVVLKRYFRQKNQSLATTPKTENLQPSQDWGEAVDTSIFYERSLRDATPLDELLTILLQFLSKGEGAIATTESGKLSQLLEYLRLKRCLIVLDNFDAVFASGQRE